MTCVRFVLLLLCSLIAVDVHAGESISLQGTQLTITADAQASQMPDIAWLSTGVVTQAADANTALRANAREMDQVMDVLKSAGIAERDIQTSGIGLSPQYRHPRNDTPAIIGYQARNTVSIRVREITRLGAVLDALVASGANQMDGPHFSIDNPEPVYDRARLAALAQARQRAALYAQALGMKVRRIVSISEGGHASLMGSRMEMAARVMSDAGPPTSVAPGETSVSARVSVVFELED